jgi:hypothetical protein
MNFWYPNSGDAADFSGLMDHRLETNSQGALREHSNVEFQFDVGAPHPDVVDGSTKLKLHVTKRYAQVAGQSNRAEAFRRVNWNNVESQVQTWVRSGWKLMLVRDSIALVTSRIVPDVG